MTEIQRSYSERVALEERLDMRKDLLNFFRRKTKVNRLNHFLMQAFLGLVKRYRLYEILKVEHGPGEVRLTLGNLWRLTRLEGQKKLTAHTFDLKQGQWREQDPATITWRKYEQRYGINSPQPTNEIIWPLIDIHCQDNKNVANLYFTLRCAWLETILSALGEGPKKDAAKLSDFIFRRLVQLPSKIPSQVVNSALHRHILTPELLSALFPLRPYHDRRIPLSLYLTAQPYSEALERMRKETPHLMPLLNFIPPESWARPDLMQDQILRAIGPFFRQMSARALRWMRRAPAETLGYFYQFFMKKIEERRGSEMDLLATAGELVDVLASLSPQATSQPKLQELLIGRVWPFILTLKRMQGMMDTFESSALSFRLALLLAKHITAAWDSAGWRPADQLMVEDFKEREIADWIVAQGRGQGLPDRNSTWLSLKRRSDQWHDERHVADRESWPPNVRGFRESGLEDIITMIHRPCSWRVEADENAAWESVLGPMEIGGTKIRPLVSSADLYEEGREMRHCVGSYSQRCLKIGWRLFSLTEPNGDRSTLSLSLGNGGFIIDQHRGPANGPVSPAAAKIAREICRLYTQKFQEAGESAPVAATIDPAEFEAAPSMTGTSDNFDIHYNLD